MSDNLLKAGTLPVSELEKHHSQAETQSKISITEDILNGGGTMVELSL